MRTVIKAINPICNVKLEFIVYQGRQDKGTTNDSNTLCKFFQNLKISSKVGERLVQIVVNGHLCRNFIFFTRETVQLFVSVVTKSKLLFKNADKVDLKIN